MGMDMIMSIVSPDGKIKYEDIYEGRNTNYFMRLQNADYQEYCYLPTDRSLMSIVPEILRYEGCFGGACMRVGDFLEWFEKYRPDIDAGWVTKREAWLYETKGIEPEELIYKLTSEDVPEGMEFIQVVNKYDGNNQIYNFITAHSAIENDDIIYYNFNN